MEPNVGNPEIILIIPSDILTFVETNRLASSTQTGSAVGKFEAPKLPGKLRRGHAHPIATGELARRRFIHCVSWFLCKPLLGLPAHLLLAFLSVYRSLQQRWLAIHRFFNNFDPPKAQLYIPLSSHLPTKCAQVASFY